MRRYNAAAAASHFNKKSLGLKARLDEILRGRGRTRQHTV